MGLKSQLKLGFFSAKGSMQRFFAFRVKQVTPLKMQQVMPRGSLKNGRKKRVLPMERRHSHETYPRAAPSGNLSLGVHPLRLLRAAIPSPGGVPGGLVEFPFATWFERPPWHDHPMIFFSKG